MPIGKFSAEAAVHLSGTQIETIASLSDDQLWRSFALAFGVDVDLWVNEDLREMDRWFRMLGSALTFPLRIIGMRFESLDGYAEARDAIRALRDFRRHELPEKKLEAFHRLFTSNYPRQIAKALLGAIEVADVPRKVRIHVSPSSGLDENWLKPLKKLDGALFNAGATFPEGGRFRTTQEKLTAFYPTYVKERRPTVELRYVRVSVQLGPGKEPSVLVSFVPDVFFLSGEDEAVHSGIGDSIYAYVKLEQFGKVQVGKWELAERVLKLEKVVLQDGRSGYDFLATGNGSELQNFVLEQAVQLGGEFRMTLSLSKDGEVWGEERVVVFGFDEGRLYDVDEN